MSEHPLDAREIVTRLFYPRSAMRDSSIIPNTQDGVVMIDPQEAIMIGYRMYQLEKPEAVILFFHGNGEVAADYDFIAGQYLKLNVIFIVADYRGYGWSSGMPLTSTLLSDAEAVAKALPDILGVHDSLPKYIMGRSLGSAPAVHLAYTFPDRFKGLILESGFSDMPSVMRQLQIPVDLSRVTDMPVGNAKRLESITMPLLVIHGEADNLLPIENGEKLFAASPAQNKTFLPVRGAGHNDILMRAGASYFDALEKLMNETR